MSEFREIKNIDNEFREQLYNLFFAIDLNTSTINKNNNTAFLIDNINYNNNNIVNTLNVSKDRQKAYIDIMNLYLKTLDEFKSKTYNNIKHLSNDIYKFNSNYYQMYYEGFSVVLRDLINDSIKKNSINNYSNVIATLQISRIKDKIKNIDNFIDTDLKASDIELLIDASDLIKIQKNAKKQDTNNIELFIHNSIKNIVYAKQTEILNQHIENNKTFYNKVHKLYQTIDASMIDIINNVFKEYYNKLQDQESKHKLIKNEIPTQHTFNLVAPKIFNTTYKMGQYTAIDRDNNLNYDVKINIVADEIDDLRDIIFQEDITNKQLSLLPIDLALFIGFTDLSALNGNNIPINMQDTLRYITESKNLRLKDSKKLVKVYEDRLRAFDKFKAKAIITNKETNKQIRFLDPIAILENARVLDTSTNQISYIIGRSAILVILNYLAEQSKTDYLTTFNIANSYINDNQSNTIYTLNMKYYLIIKILQMGNSKERLNKYNPKINLDQLYEQTALLKNTKLSKDDKAKLRVKINKYLEHLKRKGLLTDYSYTPYKQIASDTANAITKKSDTKDTIYIKI